MRKIKLIVICFMISGFSYAGNPPEVVKKAFESKYPKATNVKWGKENKIEWEAEFTSEGIKLSSNFSNDGVWLETEKEIQVSDLPGPVLETIHKSYSGWKIIEADQTETLKHGLIYEADIKSGMKRKSIACKADGTIIIE